MAAAPLEADRLIGRDAQADGELDTGDERRLQDDCPEEALIVAGQAELQLFDLVAGVGQGFLGVVEHGRVRDGRPAPRRLGTRDGLQLLTSDLAGAAMQDEVGSGHETHSISERWWKGSLLQRGARTCGSVIVSTDLTRTESAIGRVDETSIIYCR